MANKYTRYILEPIVKESFSIAQVITKLGLKQAGGTNSHIKNMINKFGIDMSHFTGQAHNKGKLSNKKLNHSDVLVLMDNGSHRRKTNILRRSMIDLGIEYSCNLCQLSGEWNGNPITLEIDHINGNWLDNRVGNLRFLCPNCHSQQVTNRPYKIG